MQSQSSTASPNPWLVRESKDYTPLPAASYCGVFRGVEEVTVKNPHRGGAEEDRWRWTWEVTAGQYKGQAGSTLTERDISPQSLPGRLIVGMAGRDIKPGEDVRELVNGFVGKPFMFSVSKGPKGGKEAVRMVAQMPAM